MPDRAFTRLHRVTDLFVSGREIVLDDTATPPVLVWVVKLNSFQRGDAQRDAQAAQARRLVALTDDCDEIRAVAAQLDSLPRDRITDYVLSPLGMEARREARDDVLAEPEWFDKRTLLERALGLAEDGNEPTPEELAALEELEEQFTTAVQDATDTKVSEIRQELDQLPAKDLQKRYLDTWRTNVAANAMYDEYARAEVYYALRDCQATRVPDSKELDHKACTHARLLPNRAAVYDLPDELVQRIRRAIDQLSMTPADAGFSGAPESSSATSEQPSSAGDSQPSTPAETQPQPVGT